MLGPDLALLLRALNVYIGHDPHSVTCSNVGREDE
jgi:hypothetical protein